MKQLTLEELELLDTATAYNGEQHKAICGKAAMELIEYKKIEKELGIDLITLFKALKDGVYVNTKWNGIMLFEHTRLVKYKNGWRLLSEGSVFYLTTYGKTWALTKEELL